MPIPKANGMPSLAHLSPNLPNFMLNIALGGYEIADTAGRHFLSVYIRLVDLAISEYEVSREHLEHAVDGTDGSRVLSTLHGINHLEQCVITVARSIETLAGLRNELKARGLSIAPVDALTGSIGPVRGRVVHIAGEIEKIAKKGQPNALMFSEDGKTASVANRKLKLEKLAVGLECMHEAAAALSRPA